MSLQRLMKSHKLLKYLERHCCQRNRALNTYFWKQLCYKHLVRLSKMFKTRHRCRCKMLFIGLLMSKGAELTVIHALTFGKLGDILRSVKGASVYITEPALPVLMWSCAVAEPSRKKQTSMTSDEKGPRMGAEGTHLFRYVCNSEEIPLQDLVKIHKSSRVIGCLVVMNTSSQSLLTGNFFFTSLG